MRFTPDKKMVFRPSAVLRMVRIGSLDRVQEGIIRCQKCGRKHPRATTSGPDFWENGSYVYCQYCRAMTLARPVFRNFEIDLTGERKKYPVILTEMQRGRKPLLDARSVRVREDRHRAT